MLSNTFKHLLTSIRTGNKYQHHFRRLLSAAEADISNKRETGTVKRFLKDKGYGFISRKSDGSECFVHFKNINVVGFKTLEQGQEVEFIVEQGEKGVEAKDVSILSTERFFKSPPRKFSNFKTSSSQFDFGGESSLDTNATDTDLFSSERKGMKDNNEPQTSTVKRWSSEKGFGFIRAPDGSSDLFCHVRCLKDGLRELEEGQTVSFRVRKTEKGIEAYDVTIQNDSPAKQQNAPSGARETGIVKKWIQGKGYGFLKRDSNDKDIFIHVRDLSNGITSLEEGQTVEFDVDLSERGEIAKNVTMSNKD